MEENAELAVAAVEKIDNLDILNALFDDRSTHKRARVVARDKLDALAAHDHPFRQKQRRARQLQLCQEVEALLDLENLEQAVDSVKKAQSQWEELSQFTAAEEKLQMQFEQSCTAVLDRKALFDRQAAEKLELEKALEKEVAQRTALCERVEQLSEGDVVEALAEARAEWQKLGPVKDEQAKTLAKRFAETCEKTERQHEESAIWRELETHLESLISEAQRLARETVEPDAPTHLFEIKKRWAELAPSTLTPEHGENYRALDARFQEAVQSFVKHQEKEREQRQTQQQETLGQTQELLKKLEAFSETEELNLKEAFREFRESQTFLKEMGPLPPSENRKKWRAKLSDARKRLHLRIQDYKETDEWRRWANVDLQEKLIKRMKALQEMEDLREAAKQLKEIQLEWKQVSAVPKSQAENLWQRFKEARDEARARCDDFFGTLDKERSENLKKKNALCEKVEALTDSAEWEKTAQSIKVLQQEWKQIGAVPQRESNAIWKRFRKACDTFFERRKEHYSHLKDERDENLKRKVELCEKAEALQDSTDWSATADGLKRLQLEWKKIGPVPRKKSDAIWKRFRSSCDYFFDRFKRRDEVELTEKLRSKVTICEELESLQPEGGSGETPNNELIAQKVRASWNAWNNIGNVPKDEEEKIESRFRKICAQLVSIASETLRGTELDPTINQKKKEKLCERLEELVRTFSQTDSEDSLEDLAERLKTALAARTIGGDSPKDPALTWKESAQEVRRLKTSWERLGPVPEETGESLDARFQKAYSEFFALKPSPEPRSSDRRGRESSAHR